MYFLTVVSQSRADAIGENMWEDPTGVLGIEYFRMSTDSHCNNGQ